MAYIFENEKKVQKNRLSRLPKVFKVTYGSSAFYTANEGRIELIQLAFIKKRLKKLPIKRDLRLEYIREKIWFCITPNFKIHQKSKNSRMGKGKGLIERHTVRIRKNVCLFEFVGIPYIFLYKVLIKINKKLNVKLLLFYEKTNNYNFWGSRKKYTHYYYKYLMKY